MTKFSDAFWKARSEHRSVFNYKGKLYHTKTKEEVQAQFNNAIKQNKFNEIYKKQNKLNFQPENNFQKFSVHSPKINQKILQNEDDVNFETWPSDRSLRYAAYYKLAFDMVEVLLLRKMSRNSKSRLNLFRLIGVPALKNPKIRAVVEVGSIFIAKYATVALKELHILLRKIL